MREENKIYLERYSNYLKSKDYKEVTIYKTANIIKNYLNFLEGKNINIKDAEVKDVKTYFKQGNKKLKKVTIKDRREVLSRFYEFLKLENIVTENIFKKDKIKPVSSASLSASIKLSEKQEKLLKEFTEYEKNYGKRRVKAAVNSKEVFYILNYFNENDIDFLHVKINDAENLQEYLLELKDNKGNILYTSATVRNKITAISVFYDYLVKKDMITCNRFKEIRKVRGEKSLPKNILDEEKLNIFLRVIKNKIKSGKNLSERRMFYRLHVMAELLYSTGARINEIIKLKEEDFDFTSGTVKLLDSKTGKERRGFLNSYTVEILRIYFRFRKNIITGASQREYLFLGDAGVKRIFNDSLNKLSRKLKLGKFTSHNIRHSFGCQMLKAGCDIRYIQAFLGHESLVTTQIYTKIEKSDLKSMLDKFHPRKFFYKTKRKAS